MTTAARPTVLLVGESPPPNAPPGFRPFDCDSGSRLAKVLGLTARAHLLDHVPIDNIFHTPGVGIVEGSKWDDDLARSQGRHIVEVGSDACPHAETIVALGRKSATALGLPVALPWGAWTRVDEMTILACPHPSGRASLLRDPATRLDARRYLLPELIAGCPTLRPWHFDLDESEVLFDLAAALSPQDVALGVAVLRVCQEVHRAQSAPRWQMLKNLTAEQYRGTVDVSMRTLAAVCPVGTAGLADVLSRVGAERINVARVGTELRTRAKAAASDLRVRDYPVSVLRATIGRYAVMGVL